MRLLLSALFVCGSAFAQLTPAAQWFLDNSSGLGSDTNSCTSRGAPCLTVAGLLTKSIAAGDLIAVRCGSTFREQLTVPANNVGVTTYDCGSLASPLFDASLSIASGAWTKSAGQSRVYQATVVIAATGSTWVSAWENNARLVRAASIADCDATAGSYFPSSDATSPITLYIHASDSSNPGANGKVYDYSRWGFGYDSYDVTGARVYGITTRRNLGNDGSIRIGQGGIAWNVTANEGSKHNVYLREGAAAYGVKAHNAYYAGQPLILFVYNENTAAGGPVTFVNSTATMDAFTTNTSGFYGHTNIGGTFGQITYAGCSTINLDLGFTASASTNVLIQNAIVTNGRSAGQLADGYRVDGMAVTTQSLSNAGQLIEILGGTIDIGHLTGTTGSIYGLFSSGSDPVNLTVHDSSFAASPGSPSYYFQNTGSVIFHSKNNVLDNTGVLYGLPSQAIVDSDFNSFLHSGATNYVAMVGATSYNLAQWRATFGQDLHSTPLP